MRFRQVLPMMALSGGVITLLGLVEILSSWANASLRDNLSFCLFLFVLGAWLGFVMLTKEADWAPRMRRWLHALGLLVPIGTVVVFMWHQDPMHLLISGTITLAVGYFGEYWVEFI